MIVRSNIGVIEEINLLRGRQVGKGYYNEYIKPHLSRKNILYVAVFPETLSEVTLDFCLGFINQHQKLSKAPNGYEDLLVIAQPGVFKTFRLCIYAVSKYTRETGNTLEHLSGIEKKKRLFI